MKISQYEMMIYFHNKVFTNHYFNFQHFSSLEQDDKHTVASAGTLEDFYIYLSQQIHIQCIG